MNLFCFRYNYEIKTSRWIIFNSSKFNITSILVSHDITSEVFKLSNRVFKINLGEIQQDGTPNEVFSNQNISGKFKIIERF